MNSSMEWIALLLLCAIAPCTALRITKTSTMDPQVNKREETAGAHVISQEGAPYMGCFMPKGGSSAWLRYFRLNIVGIEEENGLETHEHFEDHGVHWGFTDEAVQKPFRFAIVRHPWDRLVSFYRNVLLHDVWLRERGMEAEFLNELGLSDVKHITFHDAVLAIKERAGPNGTNMPLVNAHYKPQHQLCQLHRIKYDSLINLDTLPLNMTYQTEKLDEVQRWTGFDQPFEAHVTCSSVQLEGEPCSKETVDAAAYVYGFDAQLIGSNFDAATQTCVETGQSAVRHFVINDLSNLTVHDSRNDERFCRDCRGGNCPAEVCPQQCLPQASLFYDELAR